MIYQFEVESPITNCLDCNLRQDSEPFCNLLKCKIDIPNYYNKPSWCPLIEVEEVEEPTPYHYYKDGKWLQEGKEPQETLERLLPRILDKNEIAFVDDNLEPELLNTSTETCPSEDKKEIEKFYEEDKSKHDCKRHAKMKHCLGDEDVWKCNICGEEWHEPCSMANRRE